MGRVGYVGVPLISEIPHQNFNIFNHGTFCFFCLIIAKRWYGGDIRKGTDTISSMKVYKPLNWSLDIFAHVYFKVQRDLRTLPPAFISQCKVSDNIFAHVQLRSQEIWKLCHPRSPQKSKFLIASSSTFISGLNNYDYIFIQVYFRISKAWLYPYLRSFQKF